MAHWLEILKEFWEWLKMGGDHTFRAFYADALRSNLFQGFLTLCAFLFSVKTFLLITLQKDVYGTAAYGKRIEKLKQVNPSLTRYGQLRRLNVTIFWAVATTFAAATVQLTIGLVDANWAALFSVVVAAFAAVVVAWNLFIHRVVIADWLAFLEDQKL